MPTLKARRIFFRWTLFCKGGDDMAQLSFLYSPQKDKEILKEELSAGSLKGKDLDAVFSFLTGNGCTSLSDVDFETDRKSVV